MTTQSVTTMHPSTKEALYRLIDKWHKAKEAVALAQEEERTIRAQIVEKHFADAEEGTNTLKLEFGKALKMTKTVNRKINEDELNEVVAAAKAAKSNSILAAFDETFKYKPSLKVGEWRKLDDETRGVFSRAVTESPGSPQLEIATPKRA